MLIDLDNFSEHSWAYVLRLNHNICLIIVSTLVELHGLKAVKLRIDAIKSYRLY